MLTEPENVVFTRPTQDIVPGGNTARLQDPTKLANVNIVV